MVKEKTNRTNAEKYSWVAPENVEYVRSPLWYSLAGVFAIGSILYGVMSDSAITAITFAVLVGFYYLASHTPVKQIKISITSLGIVADDKTYTYSQIKSFWIVYDPAYIAELRFEMLENKKVIKLQIANADPNIIRDLLVKEIPEIQNTKLGLIEIWSRALKI